jgi:hypothetical protein
VSAPPPAPADILLSGGRDTVLPPPLPYGAGTASWGGCQP